MAQQNYLVEGLSGVGKSAVCEELIRRGHYAISTDRTWAYSADPETELPGGPSGHDTWMWNARAAVDELESPTPEVLFVCGSSRNTGRFLGWFTDVFTLRIDDESMRRRLEARTADDWPLGPQGIELMLRLNRERPELPGAIDIDATRPLDDVVDEVLHRAGVTDPG
nr:AAA family ATPase [Rhodococcus sp. (in: high G+C Gram-positive bacteria)]